MTELGEIRTKGLAIDRQADNRYRFIVEQGKKMFAGSALVNPDQQITPHDISLIASFHQSVSTKS